MNIIKQNHQNGIGYLLEDKNNSFIFLLLTFEYLNLISSKVYHLPKIDIIMRRVRQFY